jgi:hypothetical protein
VPVELLEKQDRFHSKFIRLAEKKLDVVDGFTERFNKQSAEVRKIQKDNTLARRKVLELNDKTCKENNVGFKMGPDEHTKLLNGEGDWATVNKLCIHNEDDAKVFKSRVDGKAEHSYSSPMKNRLANIIINNKTEKVYMMNRDRYDGNEDPSGPKKATTQKAKPQVATKLANKMSKQVMGGNKNIQ